MSMEETLGIMPLHGYQCSWRNRAVAMHVVDARLTMATYRTMHAMLCCTTRGHCVAIIHQWRYVNAVPYPYNVMVYHATHITTNARMLYMHQVLHRWNARMIHVHTPSRRQPTLHDCGESHESNACGNHDTSQHVNHRCEIIIMRSS